MLYEVITDNSLLQPSDALTTSPYNMRPKAESALKLKKGITRQVSLNEGESEVLCVEEDIDGNLVAVPGSTPPDS